ncbi:tape measure protein [Aggregatibacter kilianii]|uniref:tape measure protein n=1 Tax=Aggregatibacter kilianii TaxID=2025884 RepID=UPI000D657AC4|nr:tape measure protein [Aggregatibacter kilianii]
MASTVSDLLVRLGVDDAKFRNGLNVAEARAKSFSIRTTQYLKNIENAANSIEKINYRLFNFSVASVGLGTLKNYVDGYTEVKNKLALVESASFSSQRGLQSLFDISLKTNQSLEATSSIYQRFAQNAQALGINQARVASLTETVSKAVAISGASAASAQAALMQFGQSLASGVFRGQEFNSVMEQTPGLAQAIAKGLGVSVGELRNMANAGKLTTDVIIPALERVKGSVDEQFNTRVVTISMAFENLRTSTTKWIGELDQATGASQGFATVISGMADHLTVATSALGGFAAVLSINKLRAFIAAGNEQAALAINVARAENVKTAALREQAQAEMSLIQIKLTHARTESELLAIQQQAEVQSRKLTAAIMAESNARRNLDLVTKRATAGGRLFSNALGFVGGPIGLVTIGLTAAAGALLEYRQKAEQAKQESLSFADSLNITSDSLRTVTADVLSSMRTKLERSIETQKAVITGLKEETSRLEQQVKIQINGMNSQGLQNNQYAIERYKKLIGDLSIKKGELAAANEKLEKSERDLLTLDSGKPIAELNTKLKELLPTVDLSKINIDKLGLSVEDFNRLVPSAESGANSISSAVQRMGAMALIVAGNFDALGLSVKNALSDKAQKIIDRNNRQIAIRNEKDPKKKRRLEAEDQAINSGFDPNSTDFSAVADSFYNALGAKDGKSGGKSERARDSWLSFYDEIRKKSTSSLNEINLEQDQMMRRLNEHLKKGVVSHQEYEIAKTAITERFEKQRLELSGKYAPNKLLKSELKDELAAIQELYAAGQLTKGESDNAKLKAKFEYAQQVSQNAVSPQDQVRAIYDPTQELKNKQTQELAQLQAFNEQKLITEEEFQKRRQEIIDKYKNDEFQRDMANYATGLNDLGSAFDGLASMVEQSAGKQSAAYKAMFAISKAFAIAEATVKLSQAIAQAMADPSALTPAQKFANMAAVASAGVNLISQITSVAAFATGGHVQGPGTGTSDSIPAWLSNNEFVMTSRTVDHYGMAFMNALNQRRLPRFASGGRVGGGGSPSYPGISSNGGEGDHNEISITINIAKDGKEDVTVEQQIAQSKALSDAITVKVLEVMRKQRGRDGGLLN